MKLKRFIVLGVLAFLVVAFGISIIPNIRRHSEWKQTTSALRALPLERVESAVQSYVRARKISSKTVALRDLVSSGYLRAEEIRGLEGRDAWIRVPPDVADAEMILVHVSAKGGGDIDLMMDGSIQWRVRR